MASRGHHVEAFFRLAQQLLDDLGGILEIDVDDHAPTAAAVEDSGQRGGRLSEAAAEYQETDARVAGHFRLEDGLSAIRAKDQDEKIIS